MGRAYLRSASQLEVGGSSAYPRNCPCMAATACHPIKCRALNKLHQAKYIACLRQLSRR